MENSTLTIETSQTINPKRCVYTVEEIRQMLGIGKNEAYRLTHQKQFPSIRIGNRIVIPKEAFHLWLSGSS